MRAGAAADAHVVRAEFARLLREVRRLSKRVQTNGSSAMGKARSPSGDRRVSIVGAAASVRYGTGWTATAQFTASRMSVISGSIVCGPRSQFRPTTCAPSAARIRHASAYR